ncbi:MAG: hypothetical protein JWQ11_668 [Rhizobacter sp.]|nr:hypothetical protein [Rhizobacter sp.]
MTITFRAPGAPCRIISPFPSEPDYTETRSELPVLTIAGEYRQAFLQRLGLELGCSGCIRLDEMDALLFRLKTLIDPNIASSFGALDERQSAHVSHHGHTLTLDHGAPFIGAHLTEQRLRRYFLGLVDLLMQARHGLYTVSWNRPSSTLVA